MHRKRPALPRKSRVVAEPLESRRLLSTGSVSGLVYLDTYALNQHQPTDTPLAGISVTPARFNSAGPNVSVKSAAYGTFTFGGLDDGSYTVYLTPSATYHQDYN